jgi:hypothetical protein
MTNSTNNTEELQAKLAELEKQAEEAQKESSDRLYELVLDDVKTIKTIQDRLNKDFEWESRTAAVVVHLYDRLTEERRRLSQPEAVNEDGTVTVQMKGLELNGLYQAMLNMKGTGVENARSFARLLTNVGKQVTDAMKTMAEVNQSVMEIHNQIADLEREIAQTEDAVNAAELEAEPVGDSTSAE